MERTRLRLELTMTYCEFMRPSQLFGRCAVPVDAAEGPGLRAAGFPRARQGRLMGVCSCGVSEGRCGDRGRWSRSQSWTARARAHRIATIPEPTAIARAEPKSCRPVPSTR